MGRPGIGQDDAPGRLPEGQYYRIGRQQGFGLELIDQLMADQHLIMAAHTTAHWPAE